MNRLFFVLLPASLLACADSGDAPGADTGPELSAFDLAKGGRYFDRWHGDDAYAGDFTPDRRSTRGVADGTGGPFGDGSLADANGAPLLNDAGHDYRFTSYFGWDLRGRAGYSGAHHAYKTYALPIDLLADARSHGEVSAWIAAGGNGLPVFRDVLTAEEIDDLTAFVLAMRSGRLPRASDVWRLSTTAPNFYELRRGGDADAGKAAYASTCAACHGVDGTLVAIENGDYTLGTFARQRASEGWFKVLVGHPGSAMGPQVPSELTGREQAAWILDVLAALCDRTTFPATGAGLADVEDGDARCGLYLE